MRNERMTNKRGRPKSARENAKNVSLMITPKGWKLLQSQAQQLGISRSELVERFARGEIQENLSQLAEERFLGESFAN
jgi:hypothetical protein